MRHEVNVAKWILLVFVCCELVSLFIAFIMRFCVDPEGHYSNFDDEEVRECQTLVPGSGTGQCEGRSCGANGGCRRVAEVCMSYETGRDWTQPRVRILRRKPAAAMRFRCRGAACCQSTGEAWRCYRGQICPMHMSLPCLTGAVQHPDEPDAEWRRVAARQQGSVRQVRCRRITVSRTCCRHVYTPDPPMQQLTISVLRAHL